ncbi:hypothetical protein Cgig2_001377 [Carnegiea gigantea]|uniref:Uncharacterized protein n=1 Tax=Carnegiea gigantea TaxID=171969 RepID=A0A9Q1KVS9_9CARY|nr:hypothetical protein Cgig2_001377 [Carnegiea gigantea]
MENTTIQSSCSNDENSWDEPKKIVGQFYIVKIESSFVDSLKSEIEMLEEMRREMDEAKAAIAEEIASIKDPNFESKLEAKSKIEPINFDEKIEELSRRLIHGRRSIAEEKRMLRQVKELQRRKDQPNDHALRLDWSSRGAMWRLKNLRCQLKRETQAKEQFEQKKAEMEKEIVALEQKKAKIIQKKGIVNQRVLQLKMLLNDQNVFYDEYITTLRKTKELAEKEAMVAYEELCNKQAEEFMSRWKDDDLFRSNYKTSIITSLRDRKLSYDGRMRNYGERFLPNNS